MVLSLPTLPDPTHGTQCTDTDKRWFAPTGEGGLDCSIMIRGGGGRKDMFWRVHIQRAGEGRRPEATAFSPSTPHIIFLSSGSHNRAVFHACHSI